MLVRRGSVDPPGRGRGGHRRWLRGGRLRCHARPAADSLALSRQGTRHVVLHSRPSADLVSERIARPHPGRLRLRQARGRAFLPVCGAPYAILWSGGTRGLGRLLQGGGRGVGTSGIARGESPVRLLAPGTEHGRVSRHASGTGHLRRRVEWRRHRSSHPQDGFVVTCFRPAMGYVRS